MGADHLSVHPTGTPGKGDHENEITMSHRDGLGRLALICAAQSANRRSAGLHRCVSFVEVEGANDYNRRLRNKRV
jgi:hypothetical protein